MNLSTIVTRPWRRHPLAAALSLLPALALAAPERDLTTVPLEQLLTMEVYSASKYLQKASQAPSTVTVISAADIRAYGWRTLADVARSVRGLYVSYDRNYSYLGARGFLRPGDYNTRFLLQIDGNRVNDDVYDQAPLGAEFPLDLELVERIEFVSGPGSSIYGSNAFFGVINVITKKPADLAGARLAAEAAQGGHARAHASYGWRDGGGTNYLLSASRQRSTGRDLYYAEFDTPEQNHGVAQGLDGERITRVFASVAHGPLTMTVMHAARIKAVPTASFSQPFNDPRSQTTDQQSYASAAWRQQLGASEEISARLFWGRYDSFGDYPYDKAVATVDKDGSNGRWWGADLQMVSTRVAGHRLLAGFDMQHDYRLHQYTFDDTPYLSYLDDTRRGERTGVYVQDEIALGPFTVDLGLRYDHNDALPGVFSPRGALIWQAAAATTVKAIAGSAYRAPNSYERYYTYPGDGGQLPNPGLAKERIVSTELALVQQLGEQQRLTATIYRNVIDGLISQQRNDATMLSRFENANRAVARGLEVEYEARWGEASLRASYAWNRVGHYDAPLPGPVPLQANAPTQLAKLNAVLPLAWRWQAGAEAQYVGPRQAISGSAGGFWLANVNLVNAHWLPGAEVSIGVTNLFDRRYADPGSVEHLQQTIAQDGRTLRARIAYAF